MFSRILINILKGGFAFGTLNFEDGSSFPVQIPISTYSDLCENGFFAFPADIPPSGNMEQDGDEPLNYSNAWYTEKTEQIRVVEEQSGERVF
jgi:hypothetical protein